MMTKEQALEMVTERLLESSPEDDTYVVVDEATIEKPFGWVFFFNSRTFLETGENGYRLAGNGPVIVNKYDGTVEFCGTYRSVEESIDEYGRNWAKAQQQQ